MQGIVHRIVSESAIEYPTPGRKLTKLSKPIKWRFAAVSYSILEESSVLLVADLTDEEPQAGESDHSNQKGREDGQ